MTEPRSQSHWIPRSRDGRIATSAFLVLFLLAMPPVTHAFLDDTGIWFGGVPFLFVALLVVYCLLIGVLIWALRRGL